MTLRVSADLTLGPLSAADAAAVHLAVQDPELRRWLPLPRPYPIELARHWCTDLSNEIRESGRGLVRGLRTDDGLVGCLDAKRVDWRALVVEVGYWMAPQARRRGHMSAAVAMFAQWLLTEAGFERVEIRIGTENVASRRVADKAGFSWEGTARNAGFTDAGRLDLAIYSRVRADLAR